MRPWNREGTSGKIRMHLDTGQACVKPVITATCQEQEKKTGHVTHWVSIVLLCMFKSSLEQFILKNKTEKLDLTLEEK